MTLKALIKKYQITGVRGMFTGIDMWAFEQYQPLLKARSDEIDKQRETIETLEKLNANLIEQTKQLGERSAEFERKYKEIRDSSTAALNKKQQEISDMQTHRFDSERKMKLQKMELYLVRRRIERLDAAMALWKWENGIDDSEPHE